MDVLTLDDEAEFEALTNNAAAQSEVDRHATDETNTVHRYQRFYDEYREFCHIVRKDDYNNPAITATLVYNFLFYHAYRPNHNSSEDDDQDTTKLPRKKKRKTFPHWFDHGLYKKVYERYKDGEVEATDLSSNLKYIGFSHLNTMKSALINFSPPEVKRDIRQDSRIKNLFKHVKARHHIQARIQQHEKVTDKLPHWDLMPVIHKIEEMFWAKHSDTNSPSLVAAALRNRWCYNDSFQCIIRAESLWKEELSDMLFYTHQVPGEPSPYEVLVRVLWDGKTNQKQTGNALLAQCFRHVEPKKCAIGSKALYLFARFRVTEEEFDFTNNDWFKVKTAVTLADRGNKKETNFCEPMGDGTYRTAIKNIQKFLNIVTGKEVHIGRKFGCLIPQLDSVSITQIMELGNWILANGIVFQKHYSAQVPWEAMRSCAGAGKDVGRYYLPRSKIVPPQALQEMVWPSLERSRAKMMEVEDNAKFRTAHRFMNVMDFLRIVVLQDAAYFITQCPERADHSIYSDPLFHSAEFLEYKERFAREYHSLTLPENDPTLQHVQRVAPAIGNTMAMVVTQQKETTCKLDYITEVLAQHAEHSHQNKVDLYRAFLDEQYRLETQYFRPMQQDLSYIANFIRGGVASSFGGSAAKELLPVAAAAANTTPDKANDTPYNYVTPQTLGRKHQSATPPRPTTTRLPPRNDEYNNVVDMYFDWIGLVDPNLALAKLFTDTEWRKKHCKKSSAEMKRMQRMNAICCVIGRHLESKGVSTGHNTRSSRDVVETAIIELDHLVFHGSPPDKFVWSKHAIAYSKYQIT